LVVPLISIFFNELLKRCKAKLGMFSYANVLISYTAF